MMMGHERASAQSHYDYDDQMIVESYQKTFEFLSINRTQTREDVKKLRDNMESLRSYVKNQEMVISKQRKAIEELLKTQREIMIKMTILKKGESK